MVFMEDSYRAADLAKENNIDVGLHLNYTEKFSSQINNHLLSEYHNKIIRFLNQNKYNFIIYNPTLRNAFEYVYHMQVEEFERIYGNSASHINGHHHMHLCTNMLIEKIIPKGQKVRRNFTYARGEKNLLNRLYRRFIDNFLVKMYFTTDYLFSLSETLNFGRLEQVIELAKTSVVELETHPGEEADFKWLTENIKFLKNLNFEKGTYSQL